MDDQVTENLEGVVESPKAARKEHQHKKGDHMKEKRYSKEEKSKKRDDKGIEQLLKALSSLQGSEEKLAAISKSYSELVDENRKLQLALKQSEKRIVTVIRENAQLQNERKKAILTRSRLESLCRELQKQNKAVKEESLLKLREEEEKRKEVSAKFQSTLAEITALVNQNNDKNAKMHEETLEMNKHFKSMWEQVEQKEQELRRIHEEMKQDLQRTQAERDTLKKEKKQLLYKLSECQGQVRELQTTEIALRSQISMYTDKYDEFQNALTRSNKVYGEFNEEMEKMSTKILTLEKETGLWKQRWENSHAALLEMAADKQCKDGEIATLNKKLSLLQELCKMFQRERANLLAQLKEKNGTSNSESANQAETQENTKQVDEFSKECQQLKDDLALQGTLLEEPLEESEKITKDIETTKQESKEVQTKSTQKKTGKNKEEIKGESLESKIFEKKEPIPEEKISEISEPVKDLGVIESSKTKKEEEIAESLSSPKVEENEAEAASRVNENVEIGERIETEDSKAKETVKITSDSNFELEASNESSQDPVMSDRMVLQKLEELDTEEARDSVRSEERNNPKDVPEGSSVDGTDCKFELKQETEVNSTGEKEAKEGKKKKK